MKNIDRALARAEGWLIVVFLWLMITLTFLQVILRSLYNPLARLLVLWVTFLGASLLTGDKKHIKIDILSDIFPPKWQPFRGLILSIVCVLISALMLKASIDYIKMEMAFGGYLFLKLPTWVSQLILPAGFSMILFRFLLRGIEHMLELFRSDRT
ncbi:MAG: TRAP transporter small permease [Deltaproteobacteria bacterium]|nr:TRAP transporter small permease [Deltaproteobacteria bacterium]